MSSLLVRSPLGLSAHRQDAEAVVESARLAIDQGDFQSVVDIMEDGTFSAATYNCKPPADAGGLSRGGRI